jgi:aminoglycoside phosphotransferase (APT) family kinase protein
LFELGGRSAITDAPRAAPVEVLTPELLDPILGARLGAGARCAGVERGPVGNGQETWFLEVEDGTGRRSLVLRRSAAASTLGWTERRREYEVLRALARTDLPVPEVIWLEAERSPLGRPYFVMERAPGAPLGRADGETRALVAERLGTWLARLHAVAPDSLEVELERPRDGSVAAREELRTWRERYLADRLEPVPLLGGLLAWLEREAPADPAPVALLWGDPGPHNVLVAAGEVSALLDWELSHLGHPLEDLGAALWACLGELDPELVIAAYERESGTSVERRTLRWFECFACVNRSIMLIAGVRAYVEGRTRSPALAALGLELLTDNLERAAAAAGWPAPPPTPASFDAAVPSPGLRPGAAELSRGVAGFLGADVLGVASERHIRRGLKTAVALLETAALQQERGAAVAAARRELAAGVPDELAAGKAGSGELEEAACRVERDEQLAPLRGRVRRLLLEDLRLQQALLGPLRDLYGRER